MSKFKKQLLAFGMLACVIVAMAVLFLRQKPTMAATSTSRIGERDRSERGETLGSQNEHLTRSSSGFASRSVEERNQQIANLRARGPSALFEAWLKSSGGEDPMKQTIVGAVLSRALREPGSGAALEVMRKFLLDPTTPANDRSELLVVAADAATPETLEILLTCARALPEPHLRRFAADQIIHSADSEWGGRFHGELSPLLEKAWAREAEDTQYLSARLAMGLAKIGSPTGTALLLESAFDPRSTKRSVARRALQELRNPASVPLLVERLSLDKNGSDTASVLVSILARIGDETAATALINWARAADSSVATILEHNFTTMKTQSMLSIARKAISPAVEFRSEANRTAIRAGLAAHEKAFQKP